jgi:hypothetical protein
MEIKPAKAKRSQKKLRTVQSSEFKARLTGRAGSRLNKPGTRNLKLETNKIKQDGCNKEVRILTYLRRKIFLSPLLWRGRGEASLKFFGMLGKKMSQIIRNTMIRVKKYN